MKTIALLISMLIISQSANAVQTCETYITDRWSDTRYSVELISGENVVVDNKTGLMWKQCSEGLSGSDCATGSITTHTWQQALDLADATDSAGYTDWRVPNQKELRTIVARNCYAPSINQTVFPNTPPNWFWSSSPFAFNDSNAWIVNLGGGFVDFARRDSGLSVRLVRSGQ